MYVDLEKHFKLTRSKSLTVTETEREQRTCGEGMCPLDGFTEESTVNCLMG